MHHFEAIEQSKQIDPIIRHNPLDKIDETAYLWGHRQPSRYHSREHQAILLNGCILALNEPIKSRIFRAIAIINKVAPLACKK